MQKLSRAVVATALTTGLVFVGAPVAAAPKPIPTQIHIDAARLAASFVAGRPNALHASRVAITPKFRGGRLQLT